MANFKDILKQKRQSGVSLTKALTTSAYDVSREKYDPINTLFKTGTFLNALFPKVSGFKASSSSSVSKMSPTRLSMSSDMISNDKLDMISEYSKISAKNSTVLPSMARDMFLAKENMVKLVKLQKGTPRTKAGDWLSRQAAREQAFESKLSFKKMVSKDKTEVAGKKESGFFGGLGSILGLGTTIIGGIGSLLGSVGGTIFKMIALPLAAMGPLGLLLSGLFGYILYSAASALDFDSLKNGFGNIVESVSGIFGGGGDGDSLISSNLGKTFELIKLDIEDWVNDSILLFSEMTETVKDMAIAAGVAFGVSSLAGAAGRMPPGRRVPKTRGTGATKVTEKLMSSAAKRAPALAGRLALGLLGGPVGWAITAYGIYEVMQMFSDMDDSDIEEMVKEGELTEEEAAVLINARNAKKKLDDLTEQNKNLSPELFLNPYSSEQEQLDAIRMAEEQKQKNDAEIKKLQSVVDKAESLFGQKEGSGLPGSEAKIKHGLKAAEIQQRREMLLSPGMGIAVPSAAGVSSNSPTQQLGSSISDLIFQAEGTSHGRAKQMGFNSGYDVPFGYGKYLMPSKPLSEMTIAEVKSFQSKQIQATKGKGIPGLKPNEGTSAVGIGQFMKGTIEGLQKQLGFSDQDIFSPELQDRMVHALLVGRGLNDFQSGKISSADFQNNIAKEWASIGTTGTGMSAYGQPTASETTAQLQNLLGSGSPRMPASAVSSASSDYSDTMRQASVTNVSYNSPTTNNVHNGSKQQSPTMAPASVVDTEFMKLLVGRVVTQ